jgi:transcriptional adapter 2-alpha
MDFVITGKRFPKLCSYCRRDISLQFRVKCAEATCKDWELCADCFAVGNCLYPHESSHAYHVIDNLDFPLFTKDWTTLEELLLLEGEEASIGSSSPFFRAIDDCPRF